MADIVYVDDDPAALMAHATADQRGRITEVRFDSSDPDTSALETKAETTVWLFDFFLINPASGAYKDENGLSLFQKWKATTGTRPTTILVSSDMEKALGEPLGPLQRRHVIAQRQGVEWVGNKSVEHAEETLAQVIDLADAATFITTELRLNSEGKTFGTYEAAHLCFDILKAPKNADWGNSAQRQIDRARPPREVPTSRATIARPIVSWLVAHVLPYPSFLLTDAQAALRLGITPSSFRELVQPGVNKDQNQEQQRTLAACMYNGPLANFQGRRWWRAGIDDFAWQLSENETGFRPALQALAGQTVVQWIEQAEPVLLSNADLVETDEVAAAKDCVRVTDEDFPANVDPAWVRIDDARRDRHLAAKVVFEDLALLEQDE